MWLGVLVAGFVLYLIVNNTLQVVSQLEETNCLICENTQIFYGLQDKLHSV